MRFATGFFIVAALSVPFQALAVTVTNKDDKDHKFIILEGDAKQDHVLKPNGVLSSVCAKGCILRLGETDDDDYVLEGTEIVSVEDDKLFDDTPDGKSEAVPGSNTQPPPPPKPEATSPSK
jgi:hypothetical protein